jgi:Fe-S-cluster containining protein
MRKTGKNKEKLDAHRQNNFFKICSKCTIYCCQNAKPPITPKREKIIQKYLKAQKLNIEAPFKRNGYTFIKETTDNFCIFFNKENRKCLIHPVKPETCVAGPFTFDINLKTQKIEWFLKLKKICPLAGVLYGNKNIFKKHLNRAKKEIKTLIHELDSQALCTILKIEEPETFKIEEDELEPAILEKILKYKPQI